MKTLDTSLSSRLQEFNETLTRNHDASLHLARSGFSAILLDEYLRARNNGQRIDDFQSATTSVISSLNLPYFDQVEHVQTLPGKRQPSLNESFHATLDRFKTIDKLPAVFADSSVAAIYGGSMKYGPFMNARDGADASDIDMVLFTESDFLDESSWKGLMETDIISDSDKLTFFARMSLQHSLKSHSEADITSQRFTVHNSGYTISTHIVPMDFAETMYPGTIDPSQKGHRYINDYKERPFERPQCTNYDMSRREHAVPVYNRPVDGGFVAANAAYSITDDRRYVPGMYQNLTLPDARFIFDTTGKATDVLTAFSKAVSDQENNERTIDPDVSITNTEPRLPIIATPGALK